MELGNLREHPNLKPAAFINLKLKKKKKRLTQLSMLRNCLKMQHRDYEKPFNKIKMRIISQKALAELCESYKGKW